MKSKGESCRCETTTTAAFMESPEKVVREKKRFKSQL